MFGLDKSSVLRGWKGSWHGLQGVTWGLNSLNKWKCLSFKSNICHTSTISIIYGNIYSRSYKTSTKKLAFTAFLLQLYPKPIWTLLSPLLCQICNVFTVGMCNVNAFKSELKYLMNTVAKLTHTWVRSFSNDWHSLLLMVSNVSHISRFCFSLKATTVIFIRADVSSFMFLTYTSK